MKFPTLYKLKKKVLVWEIETAYNPTCKVATYTITHGQKDGKMQSTSTDVIAGKNIGKANETTIEQQCDLEAKALWQRQIDRKGYGTQCVSLSFHGGQLLDGNSPSPMLAIEYEKFPHKVKFPCYIQPKLDGVRCLAYLQDGKVVLLSRQRKEFNHLDHIRQDLLPILKNNSSVIFDGELYSHKYTFQEIISAIKRDDPNELTKDIEYHVYDIVSDKPYKDRYNELELLAIDEIEGTNRDSLMWVYTVPVTKVDEFEIWHKKFTKQGYEGIMIRNADGKYKRDGRSQDLLKYKKFMDQEFPIIGADQNKGKLSNTCTFKCECNGTTFDVMPDGTQEERAALYEDWKNGVIKKGDLATVKFFSWSTSVPSVPRFPILKTVRTYE